MSNTTTTHRPRILTGDQSTGRLHLGHYVGSLERRLALQQTHDCFFIIANVHAFTTLYEQPAQVRQNAIDIAADYLAAGIDPSKATIFLQSEIPAIAEMTWYFAMILGYGRLMRNPTVKDEIVLKFNQKDYSFGFLMYPVGQVADILAFRPEAVPVGEDQAPHIEMTRELARRFNVLYCGVDPKAGDEAHAAKGVFPVPRLEIGRVARLPGIDGKAKMSKSLGNAIYLSDDPRTVEKKCNKIFTGRMNPTDPGVIEGNPLWTYHDAFNPDKAQVAEMKTLYQAGKIGDGECKKRLAQVLNQFLQPMRDRRAAWSQDQVMDVLRQGTARANTVAEETLWLVKKAIKLDFFPRTLS